GLSPLLIGQTINRELPGDASILKQPVLRKLSAKEILDGNVKWNRQDVYKLHYDDTGFDYSKVGKTPARGKHPRMFTSPDELLSVKKRLESTRIGALMLHTANRRSAEMRLGQGTLGEYYQKALKAALTPEETHKAGHRFMNELTVQGLMAQLNGDDPLLKETASAAGQLIRSLAAYIETQPVLQGSEEMVKEAVYYGAYLAKLYDFTAAGMKKEDRNFYTDFYKRNTTGKYSDGMQIPPHWRRWNHMAGVMSYPLSTFAVEGEAVIDSRILERGIEVAADFYTYQFSPQGMSTEGMNYTLGQSDFNMAFLSSLVRRGKKNLFAHPHFRATVDWFIHTLSPNPKALWSTPGDTGTRSLLPWSMIMVMKYYYPHDPKIDYLYAHCFPATLHHTPDVSAFIHCIDPDRTAAEYGSVPPVEMPETLWSPERGSFITRDKWDEQGVKFSLEGRTDTYFISHDHADRGNFYLSSHGREWVVDGFRSTESKYHSVITIDDRGQGYFATPASWLSYIDRKEAVLGVIDYKYCYDWLWLKGPVADMMAGNPVPEKWSNSVYQAVADRLRTYYPDAQPERDPLEKVAHYYDKNIYRNSLIWKEDSWPMRLKHYPVEYAYRTAGLIKGEHPYVLVVDDLKKDDLEHLYEWILPMPMDVELVSIKQLLNVEHQNGPVNIGFNEISNQGKNGVYEMIVGDKRMKRDMREVDHTAGAEYLSGRYLPSAGDPQLLVRLLDKTPPARANLEVNPRLEVMEHLKTEDIHQFYMRSMGLGKRLVLPSRATRGDFKVLLFPHLHGEELPYTEWNSDKTELIVRWSDQEDRLIFRTDPTGRTLVSLYREGEFVFDTVNE
ncbi:MAG: heparinase II/III-family protein, partial [Bacteroides sp.]|nr:heparinase II/III-family protein [Bacteroides sp.]